MKIGIIGLSQTGKKTLYKVLTGQTDLGHVDSNKPLAGVATIRDQRFDDLVKMYKPKKQVPARIDLALLCKLEKESIARGDVFQDIADMDALCHVVRAFENEAIYHAEGSVNPVRDVTMVHAELLLHDLVFVEKRLDRLEISIKKLKTDKDVKEQALLLKMKAFLEAEKPLRLLDISSEEKALISSYPFITLKQLVVVLNVSDEQLKSTTLVDQIKALCQKENVEVMQASAQLEAEVAQLDTPEEQQNFLKEMGVAETALSALTRLCLKALGYISFFTVGQDEVRQWLVRRGAYTPEAAGVIHSDLQKGFIRAELMKTHELLSAGSEAALKAAGKWTLKGKEYLVEDGDIMNILFKV